MADEEEIYDLDVETFSHFLASELLRIESESEVFRSAMKWINHDIANRKQYVFNVLQQVRLPLIAFSEFLTRPDEISLFSTVQLQAVWKGR